MATTLLNPFSVRLKKEPYMKINTAPVYVDGDYKIYGNYILIKPN